MARRASPHPTDAELAILQVLWKTGPASLGTVHHDLCQQRPVAKTTVATMLNIMLEKQLVNRGEGERGYLWSAAVSRNDAARGMVSKLIDHVFDGSAQRMITHLVEGGQLSEEELEEVWRLVKEHRRDRKAEKNK